jgi:phosphoglycolate phosphatase
MVAAVIFDLDGTLIDSAGDIADALNRLLTDEGRPNLSVDAVAQLVGEGVLVLIERAWSQTGAPAKPEEKAELARRYLDYYAQNPAQQTTVFEGVPEALSALKAQGWTIGVCTNKPDAITQSVLSRVGLAPLIDGVVGGDFPRRKPDGEHILETLRRLGADLGASLYVGDSITDVRAARSAEIPIICVAFGYAQTTPEALGADIMIPSFDKLCDAVSKLSTSRA